jgi:signal transduction histidine kinase
MTSPPGESRELRVLLLEDDENDAVLLLRELSRLGYQVTWERVQSREAMELALSRDWDLIVSDYSMPRFDALDALDLCRERAMDLPFIIVSGTIEEEEAVESMRLGADDFITKGRLARLGPAIVRGLRVRAERRALRHAEERLRQAQKMEAIGQLAGGVAHDFNNVLGVILGYGEMLVQSLPAGGRDHDRATQILQATARGASLTRQLLTFSRQQPMEARVLDLASSVGHIESMLKRLIGENIDVSIVSDGRVGRVKADPTQIEQVIMNLVINARDAMPDGGRLIVETSSVEIDAEYAASHPDARPGPHVMLAVSDNGSGMSVETLSHIFEPFFTTKELGRGTGLGLATVYGIVRQSGGHLAVYSEVGRGTSFKIYLPRVVEAAEEAQAATRSEAARTGQETILLIEDEDGLREVLVEQLQEGGYTVVTGTDAEAALEAAERHPDPIHLVIADVVLPKTSGGSVVKRLRARRPDVRVLFMSGYTRSAAAQNGPIDAGEAFLQKPFSLDTLLQKVREVLDRPLS